VRFEGQNDSNINTTAKIDVLLSYYGLINFDLVNKDFDNLGVWPLLRYFAGNVGDDDPKKSYVGSFLGKRIKDLSQEELDNVTPNTRINENIYNKDLKVFIAHGTADITVPILQSIRLAQDFSAYLGKENVTYKEFKNFRHGDDKFYKNEGIKVLSDYLENVLS
ncbi:MAG: hypothetical protein J6X03_05035, partial [Bacilli bacterium]|nr:hypothetical protein [Bacilli bacterium]